MPLGTQATDFQADFAILEFATKVRSKMASNIRFGSVQIAKQHTRPFGDLGQAYRLVLWRNWLETKVVNFAWLSDHSGVKAKE